MTQTWDPARTFSNAVLSNGNLTITPLVGTPPYSRTFGTTGVSSSKYYWETSLTFDATEDGVAVGIGNVISGANGNYLGSDTSTLGVFPLGDTYNNGSQVTGSPFENFQSYAQPVKVCHALDADHGKYWWRVLGSNWLNDVLANQDPAANIGGISLPSGITTAAIQPGADVYWNATGFWTVVAFFAQGSWAGTAPSGFNPFDPSGDTLMAAMVM